jgi:hypothetical protein
MSPQVAQWETTKSQGASPSFLPLANEQPNDFAQQFLRMRNTSASKEESPVRTSEVERPVHRFWLSCFRVVVLAVIPQAAL